MLKFEIACNVDAVWRALHSPAVLAEVASPLVAMRALDPLPTSWESGNSATVSLSAAGAIPLGLQLIHVTDRAITHKGGRVRILRDSGMPISGPLSLLDVWDHQIAVSEVRGRPNRTLWRDRLEIRGAAAPLVWPALWTMWQWRQQRITQLAPTWAYDAEWDDEGPYG